MSTIISYNIGIIGVGVLGTAIYETLKSYTGNTKHSETTTLIQLTLSLFDKYKKIGTLPQLLSTDFIFLCLPTEYSASRHEYDKTEIYNICSELSKMEYKGVIIIKSTIEPSTTESLYNKYNNLQLIHNPEFLTARTATQDFTNQSHIILGTLPSTTIENVNFIVNFYKNVFNAVLKNEMNNEMNNEMQSYSQKPIISVCSSSESESVKIFCNSFYATKIQFFTEIKLLCDKLNIDYNNVKNMMLLNGWINEMHTEIPGHDGKISFGGKCFPKDISALNSFMEQLNVPNKVISAVFNENKEMRPNE